jgi:hypothetical protein
MRHPRFRVDFETYRLPQPPRPTLSPVGFVLCPVVLLKGMTAVQQQGMCLVYQIALEQALAAARPSLPERDLLAVWN